MMQGDERIALTGQLGNVMRESAEAALTYLRANAQRIGLDTGDLARRRAVHVHVPAGGIPKDGPSAGVTILSALASSASGRPVRSDVAMTGEITLRGKVLPVAGIKEKILAAHRAGVGVIILPRHNERDLDDVPEDVRSAIHFVLVDSGRGGPRRGPRAEGLLATHQVAREPRRGEASAASARVPRLGEEMARAHHDLELALVGAEHLERLSVEIEHHLVLAADDEQRRRVDAREHPRAPARSGRPPRETTAATARPASAGDHEGRRSARARAEETERGGYASGRGA